MLMQFRPPDFRKAKTSGFRPPGFAKTIHEQEDTAWMAQPGKHQEHLHLHDISPRQTVSEGRRSTDHREILCCILLEVAKGLKMLKSV